MSELSELEKATLQSLAEECYYTLSAHAPTERVTGHFKKHLRGNVKKALDKLHSKGYCTIRGGKRSRRWQLSRDGLNTANKLIGI